MLDASFHSLKAFCLASPGSTEFEYKCVCNQNGQYVIVPRKSSMDFADKFLPAEENDIGAVFGLYKSNRFSWASHINGCRKSTGINAFGHFSVRRQDHHFLGGHFRIFC